MIYLERFWNHDLNPDLTVHVFTWQHLLLIVLGLSCVFGTMYFAPKIRQSNKEQLFKNIMIGILVFLELIYHLHYWTYGLFSVPLHVCSFGAMFSIALLLTNSKRVFQYVFFIGVFGGLAALFIPNSLGYTYYNMRYYHYIFIHMVIVIVPMYYYSAYHYRVEFISIYKTIGFLALWSPLIVYLNDKYDRNYMFIGEKPQVVASILPEWPYYILIMFVGMFITFHVFYYVTNNLTVSTVKQVLRLKKTG